MSSQLGLVKQAIDQLGKNPEADKWITQFEKNIEAWEIAHLLTNEPAETIYRFFGAKILYSKIQKDFLQLDPSQLEPLKIALVGRIIQLSQETNLDMRVCRYLCLALSSLCIKLAQDGVISQILGWLNEIISKRPLVILELLILLAEECYDLREYNGTESFLDQLTASASQVLDFLSSMLVSFSDLHTRLQILKCLRVWIQMTNIPLNYLLQTPIYQNCLIGLNNIDLVEESCEVLISTLHKYCFIGFEYEAVDNHETHQSVILLLSTLLPHVLNMTSIWNSIKVDDSTLEDELNQFRAIARLFTEFAEASINEYLEGHLTNGEHEIINQLLKCAGFLFNMDMARIPLNFFYQLSQHISSKQTQIKQKFIARYSVYFVSLLHLCHRQLQTLDEEAIDFEKMRRDWEDAITDCSLVLGWDVCLKEICTLLQNESNNVKSIEASLVCLKTLCSCLSPNEGDGYIIWIISILPTIWQADRLKSAIIQFIGSISLWISKNPSHLSNLFHVLMQALQLESFSLIASKAILDLSRHSPSIIAFSDLYPQSKQIRTNFKINTLLIDLNILEACIINISSLPVQNSESALRTIMEPIANYIIENINKIETIKLSSKEIIAIILEDVERLICIFRYTNIDINPSIQITHPLLNLFIQLFPVLQKLISISNSFQTHEKVCRLYKFTIRSLKAHFHPCVTSLCSHLVESFSLYFTSSFIYISSICISEFGHSAQMHEVLYQLFDSISSSLLNKFSSIEILEQNPDILEEYFYFISRALKFCPSSIIRNNDPSRLVQVVQIGLSGLRIPHKDIQRSILDFFDGMLLIADPSSSTRLKPSPLLNHSIITIVSDISFQTAPSLVENLIQNITGRIPGYALRLDENTGSITNIFWTLLQISAISSSPNSIQGWIDSSFSKLKNEIQLEAKRLNMHAGSLQALKRPRQVTDLLEKLYINVGRQCLSSD